MIRTDSEYQMTLERIEDTESYLALQRAEMLQEEYTLEEAERALEPLLSTLADLCAQAAWYRQVISGNLPTVNDFAGTGQLLIALRVKKGWTQQQLADRLGVSRAQISRDEKNDYHGITLERAQRLFAAFGVHIQTICRPIETETASLSASVHPPSAAISENFSVSSP